MSAQTARRAGLHSLFRGGAVEILALVLAAAYVLLHFSPHPAFAYSIREGRLVLYSDRPIGAGERGALAEAARRIGKCEFDDPRMGHEVFLCHDAARFALFAWPRRGALGLTNAFGISFVKAGTKRSLASLIAHERTHALLARRYGIVADWLTPDWKKEGVCEFVAGDISFDVERGEALLLAGQRDDSPAFRYFTYWLAVKHLVEVEGLTLSQVIASGRSEAEVLGKAVEGLKRK